MLPRSQHSVAVSLARIIAATRDTIPRVLSIPFFKKIPLFSAAAEPRPTRRESPLPSGAVRVFSALVYREPESQRAGKSGFIAAICAPAVRFYWDVWRLVHAPLCVSIGMSGVWFTPAVCRIAPNRTACGMLHFYSAVGRDRQ